MISPSGDSKLAKLYCIQPVYGERKSAPVGTVDIDVVVVVDATRRVDLPSVVGVVRARRFATVGTVDTVGAVVVAVMDVTKRPHDPCIVVAAVRRS